MTIMARSDPSGKLGRPRDRVVPRAPAPRNKERDAAAGRTVQVHNGGRRAVSECRELLVQLNTRDVVNRVHA